MTTSVTIDPGRLTHADWQAIAAGAAVTLTSNCRARVAAGARAVAAMLAEGAPIYGINTGFGRLANVRIADTQLQALQRNVVRASAAGVGEPLAAATVRLMMALKLASLCHGVSGVRTELVDLLAAMLNRQVLPVVPAQGSVGASGDLAPLAHMALPLLGEGEVWFEGRRMAAADGLSAAGLAPLTLVAKEGLALINGTQCSTALALQGLYAAQPLLQAALVAGALSGEAARCFLEPFDSRIHRCRGHAGQVAVAADLRALLEGSALRAARDAGDDRVQDPYCLRCQPQVMGACLDLLGQSARTLLTEANGVSDNPLVFPESGEALSGGNFHAEPVAFAADQIALALCEIGSLSERRIAMLVDPSLSRLPAFLTAQPGLHCGYMVPQVSAAALVSENKQQAFPASVDSIPTSANQEDHVSMAAHGARRLGRMAGNATAVVAIELLAAAQGCDLRDGPPSSTALAAVRRRIRAEVPPLGDDRAMDGDIARVAALVSSGALAAASQVAFSSDYLRT